MKINLKFLEGKTWQGARPMSRRRGWREGGNDNISPGGQYRGRGGQPGRPPSHREPPPGPGWRWGRSRWRTGGRWRRRRWCWASPADQTPTSVRRNPDMASYICYLVIWHFYLADQSIAETEDRGEEEERDERTAPACLVDDHRHQPARDLARPGKCRLLVPGILFSIYYYYLHQSPQEMRGGDAVAQVRSVLNMAIVSHVAHHAGENRN